MNGLGFAGMTAAFAIVAVPAYQQSNTLDSVHNALSPTTINVVLGEQNKSKESGTAVVTDVPGGVKVTIAVRIEPPGASQPAHIHAGTCVKLNPVPWRGLNNAVNGSSVTIVPGVTVAQLKKGAFAINVHESALNIEHYVACGDL
jgi:hypothetical protein